MPTELLRLGAFGGGILILASTLATEGSSPILETNSRSIQAKYAVSDLEYLDSKNNVFIYE